MFNFFEGMGGEEGGHQHGGGPSGDSTKFYETLGIKQEASASEIKKAYRKLAMTHHPDKGGDENRFKEISKAYEVLSDEEKRKMYDKYGEKGLEGGAGGMDASDIFGQMFGGGGMGGGRGRPRGPQKGKDVIFKLKVTLADMYNGTTKKLRLTKQVECGKCSGKGGEGVARCTSCRGQGVKIMMRQLGPGMVQQMQVQCEVCDGKGETVDPRKVCKTCTGNKVVKTKQTLEVTVEKGMKKGSKITFRNQSDQAPGQLPGDMIVVLLEEDHKTFHREGAHLFLKKTISLKQALTGLSFTVKQLDGRLLKIQTKDGNVISPNSFHCIREEGMPQQANPFVRGNLYVEFNIEFPQLGLPLRNRLKKLLPEGSRATKDDFEDDGSELEDVRLEEVDMDMEKKIWAEEKQSSTSQYDEDDEQQGHHHGGGGAQQCAQQ